MASDCGGVARPKSLLESARVQEPEKSTAGSVVPQVVSAASSANLRNHMAREYQETAKYVSPAYALVSRAGAGLGDKNILYTAAPRTTVANAVSETDGRSMIPDIATHAQQTRKKSGS